MDRKQVELEKELVSEIRSLITAPLESQIEELEGRIDRALELLDVGPDCDDLDGWKGLAKSQADLLDNLRAALLGTEGE